MSPSEEAEIVIGRDDEVSEREARRIQDKWRDILQHEPDWPGHQYQYDIVVSYSSVIELEGELSESENGFRHFR